MPIYEYRCSACGHTLDALQKISDEHLTDCPECEEASLKRLVSAPNFRLKGGGWYETDFKSDKEKKRNIAGETEAKPKSDDAKSDKKADKATGDSGKPGGAEKTAAPKPKESSPKASKSKGEAA